MIGPRMQKRGRATLSLLALCTGIGSVIYLEVNSGIPDAPANAPVPTAHGTKTETSNPGFSMPPLRSYADVLQRPLFSPTRRPPRESAAVVSSSGFTLIGIVRSPHETHALIEHGKPPRLDRVVEDQEVDGWTVEAILDDRVVLRHAESRMEVKAKDAPPDPTRLTIAQPPPVSGPRSPAAAATSVQQPAPQVPPPK